MTVFKCVMEWCPSPACAELPERLPMAPGVYSPPTYMCEGCGTELMRADMASRAEIVEALNQSFDHLVTSLRRR